MDLTQAFPYDHSQGSHGLICVPFRENQAVYHEQGKENRLNYLELKLYVKEF